jgi:hypothetical protein
MRQLRRLRKFALRVPQREVDAEEHAETNINSAREEKRADALKNNYTFL